VVALLLAMAAPAQAYLHLSVPIRGQTTRLEWRRQPIRWLSSAVAAPGVSATDFQSAVDRAFGTWQAVPTASVAFQYGGPTSATPSDDLDGLSVLGFESHPELDRTLAATSFTVDLVTGEIVESDIFFNSTFAWSTSGSAAAFDLQSVATHEIGHLVGLGHSALGETELVPTGGRRVLASASVMFPIAVGRGNTADRTLQPDDIAGVSELYPDGGFASDTGSLQGRVRIGGRGVFGAHVIAYNLRTGALVGGFSLSREGEFTIAGLGAGPYAVRIEPLDDASVDSFFDDTGIDAAFAPLLLDRLVAVPAGGASATFDATVRAK
jgi:hypothetical protein